MPTDTDAAVGRTVLHAWGSCACGPEGDGALIDAAGTMPDVVVTPSYWGGRRRELLAGELIRRGCDARIGDIATELMGLEPPTVDHSFLVEVETRRICVSRLDFGAGLADSRLSFRGGDATEVIRDLVGELLRDAPGTAGRATCTPDLDIGRDHVPVEDSEFIVAAGDDRLIADMRRRGWLAFPVPAELLGRGRSPVIIDEEAVAAVAFDERGVHAARSEDDVDRDGAARGLDVAALRRRARELEEPPAAGGYAKRSLVMAAFAVAVAAVAITAIVDGPVGDAWKEESTVAASIDDRAATGGPAPGSSAVPPAPELAGPDESGRDEPGRGTAAEGEAPHEELSGNGVLVELPVGWRVDQPARPDALVLVDGGSMRVLVTAGEVAPDIGLDELVAGLAAHSAGNPAMDRIRVETIGATEVVVHEERPDGGSVVLWHHRIVDGWQISVGCQFREATIPQIRTVCEQAVHSAGVVGGG